MTTRSTISFAVWAMRVEKLLRKMGISMYDVHNCNHKSWYDSGMTIEEAARRVMAYYAGELARPGEIV